MHAAEVNAWAHALQLLQLESHISRFEKLNMRFSVLFCYILH